MAFTRGTPENPGEFTNKHPRRVGPVSAGPDKPNPKPSNNGMRGHLNPECPCPPCKARRRKAQALALSIGDGWNSVAPESEDALNADLFVVSAAEPAVAPRERISSWLQLKVIEPDITIAEAARKLRISSRALNASILRGVEEGWLRFEDPLSKIEYQIVPKVIRNLNRLLDEGDKNVTIETAKGTIFKQYQESKGLNEGAKTILALKIEMPEGENIPKLTGQILGTPRVLVSEVKNETQS